MYEIERLNNYPFVLFHGFAGYGDDDLLSKVVPYFGMFSTNIKKFYAKYGVEIYTPSISGYSSMWDRACEMYAHIVGGRVDYGKVHSEKYGHARYGRTYKALIPDWGQLDAEGKIKKINLMGHSFGGPTARFFINMLIEGSKEEIEGTPAEELSEFFKGGHKNLIHSCITLAGANDGLSFVYATEKVLPAIEKGVLYVLSALGNTPFAKIYDPMIEHFGIGNVPSENKLQLKIDKEAIERYRTSDDFVIRDLTIHYHRARTGGWKTYDNIYYFTYSACCTKENKAGNHVPVKDTLFLLKPVALLVGRYKGNKADANHAEVGPEWKMNDGLQNTIIERHPRNERFEAWSGQKDIKPGIWYDMPIEDKDHMSYCGLGESREDYSLFFYDIIKRVSNLPSIDL